MAFEVGKRVVAESESTDRRVGALESLSRAMVVGRGPYTFARYRSPRSRW
jgi:hypothetical protein